MVGNARMAQGAYDQQDSPVRETDLGPGSLILNVAARRCNQAVEGVPQKSLVKWVWIVEDFDIGFSAIWRSQNGDERILVEYRKYQAGKKVSGFLSAEQGGFLILSFDNSWGLLSSRRVRYKIEIRPASSAENVPSRNPAETSSLD
ncbi:phosphatidylinositol transfer-like protein [Cyclospora cayetanensis]|uniref:Phosphatidylinositol transfer-like protein n=1 Tax=Cyclospora cayetanensis TaxID=88456 RepID=A0A1D3D3T8_9EIME|nr:phosphatidylinositol transfer-like protein [Cyclospora cayetanensis]